MEPKTLKVVNLGGWGGTTKQSERASSGGLASRLTAARTRALLHTLNPKTWALKTLNPKLENSAYIYAVFSAISPIESRPKRHSQC